MAFVKPALRGVLREAAFLTPDRVRAYARVVMVVVTLALVALVATSHGGIDVSGKPLGTDFVSFWSASRLALQGHPAAAYDPVVHGAVERGIFDQAGIGYYGFFYPPVFLLICLPLALLPYLPALAVWLVATGVAFWRVLSAILPGPGMTVVILAYPAVFLTIGHGQNGLLSAALFGGIMLALPRRPVLAGVLCGCLAYKPHLGLALPVMLIAGGRWASVISAVGTVLVLILVSVMVFGLDTWRGFLGVAEAARSVMELGLVGFEKQVSVFAAARSLGVAVAASYAVQVALALGVGVGAVLAVRRTADGQGSGALAAAGTLLMTPFALDYDLTIVAVPLAWLLAQALRTGFRPYEKSVMAAAYFLPAIVREVTSITGVSLGPPILLALFLAVARRVLEDAPEGR